MENYADLMFHEAVTDLQKEAGSFDRYQTLYPHRRIDALGDKELTFLKDRESMYIASVTADGWPYVQHRGGPRGFIKVTGANQIACADYSGNQQFITMGNVVHDKRVSLFFMDYMNGARLKIQGKGRLIKAADADPDLLAQLDDPDLPAERVLLIDVIGKDWNCPQYIPKLYPAAVVQQAVADKLGALQAENEQLKAEVAALRAG